LVLAAASELAINDNSWYTVDTVLSSFFKALVSGTPLAQVVNLYLAVFTSDLPHQLNSFIAQGASSSKNFN
jgi:hypothetical protein